LWILLILFSIVAIPVLSDDKIIAILYFYFKEKPANGLLDNTSLLESFSKLVSKCIFYCNRMVLSQKKHDLLNELMNEYQKVGKTNLKELFKKFIEEGGIVQSYFNYTGASFFVWDDLNHHYKLCSTTGLWKDDGTPVQGPRAKKDQPP